MNSKELEAFRKEYERYGFPDYDTFFVEFEFGAFDPDKYDFLKGFCRFSSSVLNKFASYAAPFFIPGGYYSSVVMASVKDKQIIDDAHAFHREIMVLYHKSLKAELGTEKERIVFMKDFFAQYPALKTKAIHYLDVCEKCFGKQEKTLHDRGYLG